ncbi:reprolysin-like metallopeptidase [Lutimonas sp.]|uniref:zinc-dependent metalloprotease n=1 Tax=Lutimonas sp. TaxID=1872403 RepID=UPI003D9B82E5
MRKRNLGFLLCCMLFIAPLLSAQQTEIWTQIDDAKIGISKFQRKIQPEKYKSFHLDVNEIRNSLKSAPEKSSNLHESNLILSFPNSEGKMKQFRIKELPVMNVELAKKFPNNRSYTGVAIDHSNERISFSLNQLGLHAMVKGAEGVSILDPINAEQQQYKVYAKKDVKGSADVSCLSEDLDKNVFLTAKGIQNVSKGMMTFRLALAVNGNYSQYHLREFGYTGSDEDIQRAIIMAELTKVVTKINAVYEQELAMRFELVENNDRIIFFDPVNDPYSNGNSVEMLLQNQNTLDKIIGPKNYDIGHVFSTSNNPVAVLRSACIEGIKAQGVSGMNQPMDDVFYYDVVSHEFGHQFGANHTFNGNTGTCGDQGQLVEKTAVEPGSGSTLMAYAGYCRGQNLQSNSDLYFHGKSIEEINDFINSGFLCVSGAELENNRHVPLVEAGVNRVIPKGTAFKLMGEASDADGDKLTYCWEQIDAGLTAVPPIETAVRGALYRSIAPQPDSVRYFPSLKTLRNNFMVSTWEVTPAVERDLNFRLTVRDNHEEAGFQASDDIQLKVSGNAGPFVVLSQNSSNKTWIPGSKEVIEWDVAGTDSNGINVSKVNVLLSTDGGLTYPTVIASGVDNSGFLEITVPQLNADQCLIMIEAVDNVFFAVNSKFFSIGDFDTFCNLYESADIPREIVYETRNFVNSLNKIEADQIVKSLSVSIKLNHSFVKDLQLKLESPQGTIVDLLKSPCNDKDEDIDVTFDDEGVALICASFSPSISGKVKALSNLSQFYGENAQGAWKLIVADLAEGDDGVLESWSLEICSSKAVLDKDPIVLGEFKVFPNPSGGQFQITFSSDDIGAVEVAVHDLLGRKVFNKAYRGSGSNFNETIDLEGLPAGIYVLRVKNGSQISVEKLSLN